MPQFPPSALSTTWHGYQSQLSQIPDETTRLHHWEPVLRQRDGSTPDLWARQISFSNISSVNMLFFFSLHEAFLTSTACHGWPRLSNLRIFFFFYFLFLPPVSVSNTLKLVHVSFVWRGSKPLNVKSVFCISQWTISKKGNAKQVIFYRLP